MGTLLLIASLWSAPPELPGFPVHVGPITGDGVTLADLEGDGRPEIILAGESVSVLQADGSLRPGFPVELQSADPKADKEVFRNNVRAAPAACALSGQRLSVVVAAADRHVYAFDDSGKLRSGFPVKVDGIARGPLTCLPRGPIFLTTDTGSVLEISASGGAVTRLASLGQGSESGVAIADIERGAAEELVVTGGDSKVYVLDRRGKVVRGFQPYAMSFRSSGVPAIGDIDDDGALEIVLGSQDFKVHALDADGSALKGFPVATAYRIYAPPALADVDGDGVLDIVVGSGDKRLHVLRGDGSALPGFPVGLDGPVEVSAAVGDLDRDGRPEMAVVTRAGTLYVLDALGRGVPGFPVPLGDKVPAAPAVGDLDGDGNLELVAVGGDGMVHAYRAARRGSAKRALAPWPMAGHDPGHTGRHAPNAGRFKDLTFAAARVRTTDALEVRYGYFDLDGDAERNTQIRWYKDGALQADLNNQRRVPPERTRKGERWHYTLQDGQNYDEFGEAGVLARTFTSATLVIENTPPGSPRVRLDPAEPSTTIPLRVLVDAPGPDPDGDAQQYRYVWLRNREPQDLKPTLTTIDPAQTRKHDEWRVIVVPVDGEAEGEPATATVEIRNTAPGAAKLAPTPAEPRVDDEVVMRVVEPAPDADADEIGYRFRYWVNGERLLLPETLGRIGPRSLNKHDVVKVLVVAWDGEQPGPEVELGFAVQNTPPASPKVAIWPSAPRTDDDLVMSVIEQVADRDGDFVTWRHRWLVDGLATEHGVTVPKSATRRGQVWTLVVTPFDGEAEGAAASVQATLRNTPPTAPVLAELRRTYFTDEVVEPLVLEAPRDADADALRLRYLWRRNGKAVAYPDTKASLQPDDTRKGEQWQVLIHANDGMEDSAPVTLSTRIINSRPTAPEIQLSAHRPTAAERVSVTVSKASTDRDGDTLVYRYRWARGGELVPWPLHKHALEPGEARRDELWRVEVRAYDGEEESEPAVAELRVVNHAPFAPRVRLAPSGPGAAGAPGGVMVATRAGRGAPTSPPVPAMARTEDDLRCEVAPVRPEVDADVLVYWVRWFRNGEPLSVAVDTFVLSSGYTKKGDLWECEARAYDGDLLSEATRSAALEIVNTPPPAPAVGILPTHARTDDDLTCVLLASTADADGDAVRYQFSWFLDDKPWRSKDPSVPRHRVPSDATRRGQRWRCDVLPADGTQAGATGSASAVIINTLPTAPKVALEPESPEHGAELRCVIEQPSRDDDGDVVRYRYTWLRNNEVQPFAETSMTVPGRLVKASERWQCRVTPNDGQADGSAGESARLVVSPRAPDRSR